MTRPYAAAMAASGPAPFRRSTRSRMRRRQRSVRVTVAVALLVVASLLVVAALPTRSATWLSLASVLAMALAWAALRMMWTEVLQSRRENAADRAAAAKAYRELFAARSAEHAEFTSTMTERLAEAQMGRRDLEALLGRAQARASQAERRLVTESRELVETRARVAELEQAMSVTDLVAWQERHDAVVREASLTGSRARAASGAPRSG